MNMDKVEWSLVNFFIALNFDPVPWMEAPEINPTSTTETAHMRTSAVFKKSVIRARCDGSAARCQLAGGPADKSTFLGVCGRGGRVYRP